jgi:RNA polymerase sigma-70 factor (ECF subfamily)
MKVNPKHCENNLQLQEELIWIERAQNDPKCFGPLYRKYHDQIFRYIKQKLDDPELVFDITSQVFMKAINNIHKYQFRGLPFSSWLYRIAKSELYQSFRDRKADRIVKLNSVRIFEMIDEFEEDQTEENKGRLFLALSKLNAKDLQIIELRFFEKRTFKEIGDILELKENNAKVRSFRALEKLKILFNSINRL